MAAAPTGMAEQIGDGGPVALRIALERPELVRSLTLVEPVIFAAAKAAQDPAYAAFRTAHLAFANLTRRLSVPGAGHMVPITHASVLAPEVQAHLDAC